MTAIKKAFRHILYIGVLAVGVIFTRCNAPEVHTETKHRHTDTLVLALDWSPNVLHAGIFWAEMQGWYADEGIVLNWFSTEVDDYQKKPVQRLLDGEVDVAIGPSEHLFHFNEGFEEMQVKAIASMLQRDQSAFCAKQKAGLDSPSQLNTHVYLGYNTPMEQQIWSSMLSAAEATAGYESRSPGRLQVWEAFLAGEGDVVWIFSHWEGALAQKEGLELRCFSPADYGVPYGYSSVLMAREESVELNKIAGFLRATKRGYEALQELPLIEICHGLQSHVPHANFADEELVMHALADILPAFGEEKGKWGRMSEMRWEEWHRWVATHMNMELNHTAVHYYTNALVDKLDE